MFGKGDHFPSSAETPSWRDFCATMYYDYRLGKSFQQCIQSLSNCFGNHSPPWSTVHKWYKEFQFGWMTSEDSDRCGLSATIGTVQNVTKVTCLIKEDPRITENEIKYGLNLSLGILNQILHHHLGIWKYCISWVPHQLTEKQRRGRVEWCLYMLKKIDKRWLRAGLGHFHR